MLRGRAESAVPVGVHVLAGIPAVVAVLSAGLVQMTTLAAGRVLGPVGAEMGSVAGWLVALVSGSLVWRLWRERLGMAGVFGACVIGFGLLATVAES